MTLTVDLKPDLEGLLERIASERGVDPQTCARDLLEERLEEEEADQSHRAPPRNAPELAALWQSEGIIGAWADRDDIGNSLTYARELRRRAETRGNG